MVAPRPFSTHGSVCAFFGNAVRLLVLVVAGLSLALPAVSVRAQTDLDLIFDADARAFGLGFAVAMQADGKVLVGGNFSRADRGVSSYLARFNSDGSLDPTFNVGNNLNGVVRCIAVQSDGKIVIGGTFTAYGATSRNRIARLNADGTLDTGFNPGTGFDQEVISLAIHSDPANTGRIVAVGAFTSFNGTARNRVARLLTTGALDTTFLATGAGANGIVWDVALHNGQPVIVGSFTTYNGTTRNRVARLTTAGAVDTGFMNTGTGANADVLAVAIDSTGRPVIAGLFSSFNGTARAQVARLTTAGALDTTFASTGVFTSGYDTITDLKLDSAERVLLAGNLYPPYQFNFNTPAQGLARLNPDGNALDETFLVPEAAWKFNRPGLPQILPFRSIQTIAVGADDGVFAVGGMFDPTSGQAGILRVTNTGARDATFNSRTGVWFPGNINAIRPGAGGKYYVAGSFDWIGGARRVDLARFLPNARIDTAFAAFDGDYTDNQIREVVELADGKVWIFGPFTKIGTQTRTGAALFEANGSLNFFATPFLTVTGGSASGNVVRAMRTAAGDVVLAGTFTAVNGTARAGVARITAAGALDPTFTPGTGPTGGIIEDATLDASGRVLLGGSFTGFNGTAESFIVRLATTGAVDTAFAANTSVSATVNSVHVQANGQILLGGSFANSGGFVFNGTTLLNADGTTDTGFNPHPGANNSVYRALRTANGTVVVAGAFTQFQNQARSTLARLTTNGPIDSLFATDTIGGGYPVDVMELPDGKLLVRGTFNTVTGQTRHGLARFHSAPVRRGRLETAMNGAVLANNTVSAVVPLGDGRFVVAGDFTSFSGVARARIAAINVYGEVDPTFNVGTGFNSTVQGGTLLASGKILLWGSFSSYNNAPAPGLARLNADGSLDTTFTPPVFNAAVNAVHVLSDGRLLVGGAFTFAGSTAAGGLVRLQAGGAVDTTFSAGTGANGAILALARASDGSLFAGGAFTTFAGSAAPGVVKLTADGARASGFSIGTGNANNANPVRALAVASDGKLIVGGSFDGWAGAAVGGLVRLNTDGSRDTAFLNGFGTDGPVWSLAALADGRLYVGGNFTTLGGGERRGLVRLTATGTIDQVFDAGTGFTGGDVRTLAPVADGRLVVGGTFSSFQGVARSRVAILFGSDEATYALPNDQIFTAAVDPGAPFSLSYGAAISGLRYQWYRDGVRIPGATGASYSVTSAGLNDAGLYTLTFSNGAGEYTTQGWQVTVKLAPVISGAPIAQAVGYGASATFGVSVAGPGPFTYQWYRNGTLINGATGSTYTVTNVGGADFGATFSVRITNDYGSTDSTPVALTFDTNAVPGALVLPFSSPQAWSASAQAVVRTAGGQYYVGGSSLFTRLNADGTVDSTFAPALSNHTVRHLALQSDGKIIATGTLPINGTTFQVARFLASGAVDPTFTPVAVTHSTQSWNTEIAALAIQSDGKILLGGFFDTVAGTTRRFLARLNTNGTIDSTLAPTSDATGPNNTVRSILLQGSNVIIGGAFTTYANTTVNHLVRIAASNGARDTTFQGGTRADALVRGVSAQADGDLIIYGDFTRYNGTTRARLARLNADGSLDTAFDPGTGVAMRSIWDTPSLAAVLPSDNGTVIAVGRFDSFSGWPAVNSVRLTSTGAVDTQWATPGGTSNSFTSLLPLSDGSLFALGSLRVVNGFNVPVARLLSGSYPPQAPVIATAPVGPGAERPAGSRVELSALASGPGTLTFQWYRGTTALTDSTTVSGATSPMLTLRSVRASEAGNYKLRVTSVSNGFVETTPVSITVGAERTGPGSLDLTWAADPMPRTSPVLAFAGDGSAIVSIYDINSSPSRSYLRKYDANGVLLPTTTFSSGTGFEGYFGGLHVQSDGKVIAIGSHLPPGSSTARYLARMNADGSYDTTYTTAPDNSVYDAVLQSNGQLLIVGSFANISGTARAGVARITTTGTVDGTFNPGAHGLTGIRLVRLATDTANAGKVYILGYNSTSGAEEIVRLTSGGAIDATFARVSAANNSIRDIALDSSGRLLVVGSFTTISGQTRRTIARINTNGTLDATFGPSRSAGFSVRPDSVVIGTDGWIYLVSSGSSSTTYDGFPTGPLVRVDATAGQLDVNFPGPGGIRYDNLSEPRLYWVSSKLALTGYITGAARAEFIRINVGSATTGAPVLVDSSGDRTVADGSALSLFARFSGAGPFTYVWRKDGTILDGATGPQLVISAVSAADAGSYTVTATNGSGSATATMDVVLFAADPLAAVGGFQLTSNFNGSITQAVRFSDGSVLVAGSFTTVGGVARRSLARFTAAGALDATFNANIPLAASGQVLISNLIVEPDGRILVHGVLPLSNGTNASLIRLNTNGTLATSILNSTNLTGGIAAVARQADGGILVMGPFTSILGTARSGFARLTSAGTLDTTFVPTGIDATDYRHLAVDATGRIWLVGSFTRVGPAAIGSRVARLTASGVLDTTFQAPLFNNTPTRLFFAADGRAFLLGQANFVLGESSPVVLLTESGAVDRSFRVATNSSATALAEDSAGRLHGLFGNQIFRLTATGEIDRVMSVSSSPGVLLGAGDRLLVAGGNQLSSVGATSVFGLVYANAADTDSFSLLGPLPASASVAQGGALVLRAGVRGATTGTVTYQWFRDGTPLDGATGPALVLPSATLADRGAYTFTATKSGVTLNAGPTQVDVIANTGRPGEVDLVWKASMPLSGVSRIYSDAADNLYLTGNVIAGSASARPLVALDAAGTVRTNFTLSSRVTGFISGVRFLSGGKLLLYGQSLQLDGLACTLLRLNADGSLDTTFTTSSDPINDLIVLGDGRLVALTSSGMARYSAAGVRDTTYSSTSFPSGNLFPAPGGKFWIVGSHYDTVSYIVSRWLTRLNADGTIDSTYVGPALRQGENISAVAPTPDGGLYVMLSLNDSNVSGYGFDHRRIVRVQPDGTVDPDFAAGTFQFAQTSFSISDIAADAAGRLVLVGVFDRYDGSARNGTVRLLPSGAIDPSFASLSAPAIASNNALNRVLVLPSGRIVVSTSGTTPIGQVADRIGLAALISTEVAAGTAPVLTTPLADRTLNPYDTLALHAPVFAPAGATFQWRKDGTIISGATGPRYRLIGASPAAAGEYTVQVTTTGGSVTSAPVLVNVAPSDYSGGLGSRNAVTRVETPASFAVAQPDGRALVVSLGSTINGSVAHELFRLNADGTFAGGLPTTVTGTNSQMQISAAVVDAEGRIYIGGQFSYVNGVTRNRVARLLADGSVDTTWDPGAGPNSTVSSLALMPDGKLVIGGSFSQVGGVARQFLARLTTTGALDTTFVVGTGLNNIPIALAAQSDGRLLVGGAFTAYNGITTAARLIRVDTTGGLDATFAPAPNSTVRLIRVAGDGRILVGGDFGQVSGSSRSGLAWLDAQGVLLPLTMTYASGYRGALILPDNSVIATTTNIVARFRADGTADTVFNSANSYRGSFYRTFSSSSAPTQLFPVLAAGNEVLIVGDFARISPQSTANTGISRHAAVWLRYSDSLAPVIGTAPSDANLPEGGSVTWTVQATSPSGTLTYAWTKLSDPTTVLSTTSSLARTNVKPADAGQYRVVVANGEGFAEAFVNLTVRPAAELRPGAVRLGFYAPSLSTDATAIAPAAGGGWWVAGNSRLSRLLADGTVDTSFTALTTSGGAITGLMEAPSGGFYVWGSFTSFGGQTTPRLIRLTSAGALDGTFTAALPSGGTISTVAPLADGRVYVGGSFTVDLAGKTTTNFVRLTATGALDTTFDPNGGVDGTPTAIRPLGDGRVYVAGGFSSAGGASRRGVVRFLAGGALDGAFNNLNVFGVQQLVVYPDGRLLIAGSFTSVDGVPRTGVARLTSAGVVDPTFVLGATPNFGGNVVPIVLRPDGRIVIAGNFMESGSSRSRVLQFEADGALDVTFDGTRSFTSTVGGTSNTSFRSLVSLPTGQLFVAGSFSFLDDGISRAGLASLQGTPLAPEITADTITSVTLNAGGTIAFSVTASGAGPLSYQWRRDTQTIPGATAATYTKSSVTSADVGSYDVVVSNSYGSATSRAATVALSQQAQTITFNALPDVLFSANPITLTATSTSGLTVVFTVTSGNASVSGNQLTLLGTGSVTVRATQAGNASWLAATPVDRTFTVGASFSSWLVDNFTPTEIQNTSLTGPNADFDGDGYRNLVEYALGLDPKVPSRTGLPAVTRTTTDWVFTYTRPAARSDVTYTVQSSTNLTVWTDRTATRIVEGTTETWRVTVPVSGNPNLFFRLKVTR